MLAACSAQKEATKISHALHFLEFPFLYSSSLVLGRTRKEIKNKQVCRSLMKIFLIFLVINAELLLIKIAT